MGTVPPLPAIFPDQPEPIVRQDGVDILLEMMRWGMPRFSQFGGERIAQHSRHDARTGGDG